VKVVFLRAYDFPLGGAPQNRLLGICRGLIEQGVKVEVHVYAPAKLDLSVNFLKEQIYKSVPIYNHASNWSPVKSKINQIIGLLIGLVSTIFSVIKSHNKERVDYFFINVERNLYILPFYILSKIIGAKLGRDLNEYPLSVLAPERYNRIISWFKLRTNYRWFDMIFVITNNLESYYKPLTKKSTRFLLLPVTVDFDRFPQPVKQLNKNITITYCGDLSQSKDGVLTLIQAFAMIKDEFVNYNLRLIGQNNDKAYMDLLNNTISDLGLGSRVILAGYVNPEYIPAELYNSRLLVLARPDSIQAQGGFPTKLAEYLASGVPVAVTSVGELPNYLEDNLNAFMAEPDNVSSFADAMRRSLCDVELSKRVGIAGRATALEHFSHISQSFRIAAFLQSI